MGGGPSSGSVAPAAASEPASPMLRARGLRKHFFAAASALDLLRLRLRGRRVDALRGVDLELAPGEVLAIVGENGAGKSTLLRLIAGLLLPDGGELDLFGEAVEQVDGRYRAKVCYVLADERSFAWRLDGRQNLEFFATLHGLRGALARERITLALEHVGLAGAADRAVREYSSGMRQRLALARGLLGDPHLFLFDEPTRGVDPLNARDLRTFIGRDLLAGRSAIVATHDLGEVHQLCDRVIVLERGEVRGQGTPDEAAALLGLER
ncbi:MAG: ABC transporter ATP-binding protein [Proteobacteria bacterium]|nr:MAG: ABC transporter ATP-binding protein [Pseudomonadota bacterium]PIE17306.1 MAG: ABC transporter ATP-binding protein [Pseudomonadota bacterium]